MFSTVKLGVAGFWLGGKLLKDQAVEMRAIRVSRIHGSKPRRLAALLGADFFDARRPSGGTPADFLLMETFHVAGRGSRQKECLRS
jgi:hypothetical protein